MSETTCPHCGGQKTATDEMCVECRELFQSLKNPAVSSHTSPENQQTALPPMFQPDIHPLSIDELASTPEDNQKRNIKLFAAGLAVFLLIVGVIKFFAFLDEVKYRSPEEKQAWFQQKVDTHNEEINDYISAQHGIFQLVSIQITPRTVTFNILARSGKDITEDAEKFRKKLLHMLGSTIPIYVETYFKYDGLYYHVGTNAQYVGKSTIPGVHEGDIVPGTCHRIDRAVGVTTPGF